ncbi:MAG: hypothetical protein ABSD96_04415 [Candidatus Korobacteraceae bacterium]
MDPITLPEVPAGKGADGVVDVEIRLRSRHKAGKAYKAAISAAPVALLRSAAQAHPVPGRATGRQGRSSRTPISIRRPWITTIEPRKTETVAPAAIAEHASCSRN